MSRAASASLWESSPSLLRNSSITYKVTHLICWAHVHYSHTHLALRSSSRGGRVGKQHGLGKITFLSCERIHDHGKVRKNLSKATKRLACFFLWISQILIHGWSLYYNPIDFNAARQGNRHALTGKGWGPIITNNKVNNFFFANLHWSKAKTLKSMDCCLLTGDSEVIIVHGTIAKAKNVDLFSHGSKSMKMSCSL